MSFSGSCKANSDCPGIKICGVLNFENKSKSPSYLSRYCMYDDVCGNTMNTGDGKALIICGEDANRELKKESLLDSTKIRFVNSGTDALDIGGVFGNKWVKT